MFPLDFSVRAGDATGYMEIVAWLVAITFVILSIALVMFLRHAGVGSAERRQLATIIPQLFQRSTQTVVIADTEHVSNRRHRLWAALSRAPSSRADTGDQTVRQSAAAFGRDLQSVLPKWPKLAIRGLVEGAVILVFGAILFFSAAWWESALAFDVPGVRAALVGVAAVLWTLLQTAVGMFPVPETLLSTILVVVLVSATVAVDNWLAIGVGLILAAIAFAAIDRVTAEDLDVVLFPDRKRLVAVPIGVITGAWAVGVIVNVGGSAVAGETLGTLVGFAAGLVILVFAATYGLLLTIGRLRSAQQRPGENTVAVGIYILLRRLLLIGVIGSAPLAVYLVARAVVTGSVSTVGEILLAAPLAAQASLAIGIIAVIAVIASRAVGEIGLRDALGRLRRSLAIRAWVFRRGIPAISMLIAFALVWAFVGTQPSPVPVNVPVIGTFLGTILGLWPPLIAALVAGVVSRTWTLLWTRLRWRFVRFDETTGPSAVAVGCYPELVDADGESLYIARIKGMELAHRDVDKLIRDLETVLDAKMRGEQPPATVSEHYFDAVKRGTVSLEEVVRELRGDVLTRIQATLVDNGGEVDRSVVDEELALEYPKRAIDEMLDVLHKRSDLSYQDGRYIYHARQ